MIKLINCLSAILLAIILNISAANAVDTYRITGRILTTETEAALFGVMSQDGVDFLYEFNFDPNNVSIVGSGSGSGVASHGYGYLSSTLSIGNFVSSVGATTSNAINVIDSNNTSFNGDRININDRRDFNVGGFERLSFNIDFGAGSPDPITGIIEGTIGAGSAQFVRTGLPNFAPTTNDPRPVFSLNNFSTGQSSFLDITNIQTSLVSAVPEPSTWFMVIIGFSIVGLTIKRRKHSIRNLV
jgi:hypothetical protein